MGHAGLEYIPGAEDIEITYTLMKAYWGQGLATEAAHAAVHYGFEALNLTEIYGLAFAQNEPSQKVMRKLGMTYRGITDKYYHDALACYHLSREQYFAAQRKPHATTGN
jgi:ribosomal-protein-alanine N-acetyltransferase